MPRGLLIPVSPEQIGARARSLLSLRLPPPGNRVGPKTSPVYKLGAGGKNPSAAHCFEFSTLTKRWVGDCSALSAFACGFDRFQPDKFPGNWVNTDAMLRDAERDGDWFARALPHVGALLVYGGVHKNGKRVRVGHVGVCVALDPVLIVHCSSGASKRTGDAVSEVGPALWLNRGGVYLKYLKAT
jgi:hypothetical protein